jgi:23S rRNA (uracil-5-)-methyltransferase RumA
MALCSHFPDCGGCRFADIPYLDQLPMKQGLFEEALPKIYRSLIQPVVPSERHRFHRNKMEYSVFTGEDGGISLGLKRQGRWDQCVPTPDCQLLDERWAEVSRWLAVELTELGLAPYDQKTHLGILRYVIVRRSEHQAAWMINFVVASDVHSSLLPLAIQLRTRFPWVSGVMMSIQSTLSDTAYTDDVRCLDGVGELIESIGSKRYRVSPYSFFQTNSSQAFHLYRIALELAAPLPSDRLLDLYCGAATIGIFFSDHVKSVLGVEASPSSIEDAHFNIALNQAAGVTVREGKVKNILKFERPEAEIVVVDPPRSGLEPKALRRSAETGASRIVYVSCNPKTLGRDLPMYEAEGYSVSTIRPVDMFPHSPHLEAVALLRKS